MIAFTIIKPYWLLSRYLHNQLNQLISQNITTAEIAFEWVLAHKIRNSHFYGYAIESPKVIIST